MELESYRNFLAIIEAGSFTGAAECVHVAQPALSKQLKTLENFFGTERRAEGIRNLKQGNLLCKQTDLITKRT